MNQKIIEFAVEADLAYKLINRDIYWIDAGEVDIHLERFAELVRQDERDACAKLCSYWSEAVGNHLAATIRARGNT